jgi:hypothetical protein
MRLYLVEGGGIIGLPSPQTLLCIWLIVLSRGQGRNLRERPTLVYTARQIIVNIVISSKDTIVFY